MKNNLLYGFLAIVAFAILALLYNSPVITGSQSISQPDIVNYKGSANEMINHQEATGEFTYWSNAMFGGMPTYQMGAQYSHNWVQKLDRVLRFLPRPADYIFLLFVGFFVLGMVLFKDWRYATAGACFFALGTYFVIIIAAGHNAKVHAIAYFAPLTAGVLLLYQRKYLWGFVLTALAMALQLATNHPQMTYYLGFALLIYVIFQAVDSIKKDKIGSFIKASLLSGAAILLALGMNSTHYLATYEYTQHTTRGVNEVTLLPNDNPTGLDKDYITRWSYGKMETLNLLIPNFMGGGSSEPDTHKQNLEKSIERNARSVEESQYMKSFMPYLSTYWGDQPFTSGPAYQGAIVFLLFVLGLFLVKGKYKWWLACATLLSFFMAWGKNMMWFTDLLIDYVPFYDKFRAVSSALVIAEFTMPLLAILAVYHFFTKVEPETRKKILMYVGGGISALLLLFYLAGETLFGFQSDADKSLLAQGMPKYMIDGIRADRAAMFKSDTLRSLLFILASLGLLAAYAWGKIQSKTWVILGVAVLSLLDVWGVDKRYLNEENFIPKQWVDYPFPTEASDRLYAEAQKNPALMQVLYNVPYNDLLAQLEQNAGDEHFRVYNQTSDAFNEAHTSYFVSSVGGYHAAKLNSIQNIIDVYFAADSAQQSRWGTYGKSAKILNLLNTKYVVQGDPQQPQLLENPNALGNAWFVEKIAKITDANKEILALATINEQKQAVVNTQDKIVASQDSTATISLTSYAPNKLIYKSESKQKGFAVFSEIYYADGWKATIDGKEAPIYKTNYFLRGLQIPAGSHEIVFTFDPEVIQTGNTITFASNILFLLICVGSLFWWWRKDKILKKE